jgi:hypothetical protein
LQLALIEQIGKSATYQKAKHTQTIWVCFLISVGSVISKKISESRFTGFMDLEDLERKMSSHAAEKRAKIKKLLTLNEKLIY